MTTHKLPKLSFTPMAWAKLRTFIKESDTEFSALGISGNPDKPLLVTDLALPKQTCTSVHTEFDDTALADFYDDMVDDGYEPWQFGRIWIHTHPGFAPTPSATDLETFSKILGKCDWSVMAVFGGTNNTDETVHLQLTKPLPLTVQISSEVVWDEPFNGSDPDVMRGFFNDQVTELSHSKGVVICSSMHQKESWWEEPDTEVSMSCERCCMKLDCANSPEPYCNTLTPHDKHVLAKLKGSKVFPHDFH